MLAAAGSLAQTVSSRDEGASCTNAIAGPSGGNAIPPSPLKQLDYFRIRKCTDVCTRVHDRENRRCAGSNSRGLFRGDVNDTCRAFLANMRRASSEAICEASEIATFDHCPDLRNE